MVDVRRRRVARLLVVNLHATSKAHLVIPWLWAQILLRRADAVLLQECTPAHARWLRRRRRRWRLVGGHAEAIYVRRHLVDAPLVIADMSPPWWGHQAERQHPGRSLPLLELAGWLDIGSVHFPPGWIDGRVPDRHRAGLRYLRALQRAGHTAFGDVAFLAGDFNADPDVVMLEQLRADLGMSYAGERIDHAIARGCTVTRWRSIGYGPGMDHRGYLAVVQEGDA